MDEPLRHISKAISEGVPGPEEGFASLLESLFGTRYQKRHLEKSDSLPRSPIVRDAYALAAPDSDGVPYAGFINPENPPSGPYGGTSLVWMPTHEFGSVICFGVGTRGLSPDEGILTRPGHRRRTAALQRLLGRLGVQIWSKSDPARLEESIPESVRSRFPGFERAFKRYGRELYCIAAVPQEADRARLVVQAFFDLYAYERNWGVLAAWGEESEYFLNQLRTDLFYSIETTELNNLLRKRRFVILQGPPGTGKTYLAGEVLKDYFDGKGQVVQFHPAVTYEDFIVGLSPDVNQGTLLFDVRAGWLLEAARKAQTMPYLLVIDEINRADLGKVLGEAIYLFESTEVGGARARRIDLPHPVAGSKTLSLPNNLYVLATMNTADRSIANIDLAIRRRFAFVTMSPDRKIVEQFGPPLALEFFDQLVDVFVEHAPDQALDLMPGHSYFRAGDETELRERCKYELLPLLDEYLREGYLGPATSELHAIRDSIQTRVE